jgi:MFS family permease
MSLNLILLFISLFTWGIGEGLFFVFQPIYLAQLGANKMTIATIFSAFGFAMMIAHVPAGYLADRFGRKPLLIAAWTSGLLATWIMAIARTLPSFIVGMLLYGLTAFVSSPLNSYVTAARGKLTPARAMTIMSASFNFGAVLGSLAGGWLGESISMRTGYFIAGGLFILSTGVLCFLKSQSRDHHDPDTPRANLLSNLRFVGFLGIIFIVMFSSYLPWPLTANFLNEERNLGLVQMGVLGSVNYLGNALFNLLLGQFSARLGLGLVQLCVAAFSLLIWRGTDFEWYVAGYFIFGGFRTARSFVFAQVRALIHPAQMGIAFGVAETSNSLAVVLAPLLAGVLYTRDPALVYPASIGLLAVTLIISLIFAPREKTGIPESVIHTLES